MLTGCSEWMAKLIKRVKWCAKTGRLITVDKLRCITSNNINAQLKRMLAVERRNIRVEAGRSMPMVVEVIADGANGRKRSHANITLDLELRQTYSGSQYNTCNP